MLSFRVKSLCFFTELLRGDSGWSQLKKGRGINCGPFSRSPDRRTPMEAKHRSGASKESKESCSAPSNRKPSGVDPTNTRNQHSILEQTKKTGNALRDTKKSATLPDSKMSTVPMDLTTTNAPLTIPRDRIPASDQPAKTKTKRRPAAPPSNETKSGKAGSQSAKTKTRNSAPPSAKKETKNVSMPSSAKTKSKKSTLPAQKMKTTRSRSLLPKASRTGAKGSSPESSGTGSGNSSPGSGTGPSGSVGGPSDALSGSESNSSRSVSGSGSGSSGSASDASGSGSGSFGSASDASGSGNGSSGSGTSLSGENDAKRKKYKCPDCAYSTDNLSNRRRHEVVMHGSKKGDQTFPCPNCSAVLKFKTGLIKHQQMIHEGTDYSCPVEDCDYVGRTPNDLYQHSVIHRAKDFKCDECSYASYTKRALQDHKNARHLKVHPFACSEVDCEYTSVSSSGLAYHRQAAHLPKTLKCSKCGYKTNIQRHLDLHQSFVHDPQVWYPCDKCEATFTRHRGLVRHMAGVHFMGSVICGLCLTDPSVGLSIKY